MNDKQHQTNTSRPPVRRDRLTQQKKLKEEQILAWKPVKIQLAHQWIDNEKTQMGRKMVRGAVHFCNFGENIGCEQNEERPVVIISNNTVNSTSGNVLVIPLTKNLKSKTNFKTGQAVVTREGLPVPRFQSHYFLFKHKYDFLAYDSAAKTEETTSVSKIRLKEHLGNLDEEDINRLENRVKWTFGL
ncbi:MazF family transcriptional regulator [Paenibacillus sp. CAA11]|uniref:type II toxin-antitoxin system PemK/MazF family toxin n=1 Tax=Paenibacillus sp. CAA11 TaxID=1532905 RepID=UPI000D360AFB|nr:type II toxin-antitoxin system PemK/MazF family toxin [Paenibacillus sp. CAA11]AWB46020.1 MazF family transcriptional regulator [Paenibacillus sp. CAA11]